MEFKIVLEEGDLLAHPPAPAPPAGPSAASPSGSPPSPLPAAPPSSPQSVIEHALLPALAAATPMLTRELYSWANEPGLLPPLEQIQPVLEGPAGGLGEAILPAVLELRDSLSDDAATRSQLGKEQNQLLFDETGALRELCDFLRGDLLPELKDLRLAGEEERTRAPEPDAATKAPVAVPASPSATEPAGPRGVENVLTLTPAEFEALKEGQGEAFAVSLLKSGAVVIADETSKATGAAVAKAVAEELLPALEELRLEREEERGILPPLEELRLEAELPGAEAERQRRAAREKAARENVELGPAEIEEIPFVIDPVTEQAQRQLDTRRHAARVRARMDELEGKEPAELTYLDEVIDEKTGKTRRDQLNEYEKQLNSGSRIAAQAGLGSVGQAIGGAADLGIGLATGNVVEAVEGGLELLSAGVHLTAAAFDQARRGVEFFGDEMRDLAANNHAAMFDHAVQYAADSLDQIPILGEAFSSELKATVAPIQQFTKAVSAFVERGHELQLFSPELSSANALAEMRRFLDDLHEADRLGPELARLTDASVRFEHTLREMLLPIKEHVLSILTRLTDGAANQLERLDLFLEFQREVNFLLRLVGDDLLHGDVKKAFDDLVAGVRGIRENMANAQHKDDFGQNMIEGIFNLDVEGNVPIDAARDAAGNNPLFPADALPF